MQKKKGWVKKYAPKNLLIKGEIFTEEKQITAGKYYCWKSKIKETKKPDDKDLTDTSSLEGDDSDEFVNIPDIPPLEGDEEEGKEGKGLKIFTSNKLLTRLPILLPQIKAGICRCRSFYKWNHQNAAKGLGKIHLEKTLMKIVSPFIQHAK